MKVLIFSHDLVVCGTTTNAIELAETLRDKYGWDVLFFATPGPMLNLIEQKGLRFVPAPTAQVHPSPARMRALRDLVHRERPDLIYVWEWQQCLDAYYVEHPVVGVPMLMTDMSMGLHPLLPKTLPITFGTPALVDEARAGGHKRVALLLPPVDVSRNSPSAVDPSPFRERYGIEQGRLVLVTVSRLDTSMKAESLIRTVNAVRRLGSELPLQLVIVGDGDQRHVLEELARKANEELGRQAVILTGRLLDPRPAYAAADVVIGMGSSALRGMAFEKPVLIVGENGFSAPFTTETADSFLHNGMYGTGEGDPSNMRLTADIRRLSEHPERFTQLGKFARRFVIEHFSLETIASRLMHFYHESVLRGSKTGIPRAFGQPALSTRSD